MTARRVDPFEIERLEHRALDPRPWREWGHSSACEDCRWEREKDAMRRDLEALRIKPRATHS